MRPLVSTKLSSLKPAVAGLLALLVFVMTFAAASQRLHGEFHAPGEEEHHEHGPCAVCTIVNGQLDVPISGVSEVFALLSGTWTLAPVPTIAPRTIDLSVAPSRGPPASVSSQS